MELRVERMQEAGSLQKGTLGIPVWSIFVFGLCKRLAGGLQYSSPRVQVKVHPKGVRFSRFPFQKMDRTPHIS